MEQQVELEVIQEQEFSVDNLAEKKNNQDDTQKLDKDIIKKPLVVLAQQSTQQLKVSYDWIQYDIQQLNNEKTLNYLSDYLKQNNSQTLNYLALDLHELEEINEVKFTSKISNIADNIQKRLLKYGNLENISKIAKKSGAINKTNPKDFRDIDYYDQIDPFIDDSEFANEQVYQKMQLAEAFFTDFKAFYGNLSDFTQNEYYQVRVKQMHEMQNTKDDSQKIKRFRKPNVNITVKPSQNDQPNSVANSGQKNNNPTKSTLEDNGLCLQPASVSSNNIIVKQEDKQKVKKRRRPVNENNSDLIQQIQNKKQSIGDSTPSGTGNSQFESPQKVKKKHQNTQLQSSADSHDGIKRQSSEQSKNNMQMIPPQAIGILSANAIQINPNPLFQSSISQQYGLSYCPQMQGMQNVNQNNLYQIHPMNQFMNIQSDNKSQIVNMEDYKYKGDKKDKKQQKMQEKNKEKNDLNFTTNQTQLNLIFDKYKQSQMQSQQQQQIGQQQQSSLNTNPQKEVECIAIESDDENNNTEPDKQQEPIKNNISNNNNESNINNNSNNNMQQFQQQSSKIKNIYINKEMNLKLKLFVQQ